MLLTMVMGDDVNDIVTVSGLLGKTVKLPCDTSPPTSHNPLLLTVWFKDKIQDPIYRFVKLVMMTNSTIQAFCSKFCSVVKSLQFVTSLPLMLTM